MNDSNGALHQQHLKGKSAGSVVLGHPQFYPRFAMELFAIKNPTPTIQPMPIKP